MIEPISNLFRDYILWSTIEYPTRISLKAIKLNFRIVMFCLVIIKLYKIRIYSLWFIARIFMIFVKMRIVFGSHIHQDE